MNALNLVCTGMHTVNDCPWDIIGTAAQQALSAGRDVLTSVLHWVQSPVPAPADESPPVPVTADPELLMFVAVVIAVLAGAPL